MTDTPSTDAPADGPAQDPTTPDAPAKPETDWKAEAKKWETRAKENKTAAEKLAQIEEANKTEAQKTADRLAAAEKAATDAQRDALRFKIAAKFGVSDEDTELFLTAGDEATLTKQAERLVGRESERKKQGNHVPREGHAPTTVTSDERTFVRGLFGGGS